MSAPFAVKKLVTIYDLQKHINYGPHSGKEYPCDQCNKKFPRKENLKIHLEKVHEKKTLMVVQYVVSDCLLLQKLKFTTKNARRKKRPWRKQNVHLT